MVPSWRCCVENEAVNTENIVRSIIYEGEITRNSERGVTERRKMGTIVCVVKIIQELPRKIMKSENNVKGPVQARIGFNFETHVEQVS